MPKKTVKMKNIVIFGAPGAGKGTQRDKMIEKYGLGHISTGDVLRNEIKNGTELGKTAKGFIDNGQLIPDELMIDILASVYDSDLVTTLREHLLQSLSLWSGTWETIEDNTCVILTEAVPEDELMARLINRGKESGRSDDNEETIKKRLNVYHTQTAPLIDWYEKEGIHHHIEGLCTVDEIFARVCNVIDKL